MEITLGVFTIALTVFIVFVLAVAYLLYSVQDADVEDGEIVKNYSYIKCVWFTLACLAFFVAEVCAIEAICRAFVIYVAPLPIWGSVILKV